MDLSLIHFGNYCPKLLCQNASVWPLGAIGLTAQLTLITTAQDSYCIIAALDHDDFSGRWVLKPPRLYKKHFSFEKQPKENIGNMVQPALNEDLSNIAVKQMALLC